jgi:hypothetical protein
VIDVSLRLPRARVEELEQLIHAPGLKERLVAEQPADARHLNRLHIVDTREDVANRDEYRRAFGRQVAEVLGINCSVHRRVRKLAMVLR